MSEEWRRLPEFPMYEVTSDGDVRNRETRRILKEIENKKTGAWSYCLWKPDGKSTHRNCWGLIYSAWPELKPPVVEKRKGSVRGLWSDIPDFPIYQIHPDGRVRYASSRIYRKHQDDHGTKYVTLFNEDGKHLRTINFLLNQVFGESLEKAA